MASLGGIHGGWTLRAAQLHHSLRHWPTTRAPGIVQMRIENRRAQLKMKVSAGTGLSALPNLPSGVCQKRGLTSGTGCEAYLIKPRHSAASRGCQTKMHAQDPDAMDAGDAAVNQGPPTLFWRVFAALCYLVPWIDSISLGREIYRRFRNLLVLYFVPGPLAKVYFSSQFAPLIIFFVMFLSIVKNKKLHHFVRFNCMQAIMLDIVVMLMHILKAYLPAEIKWSVISHFVDMFMWTTCMGTVVYAVFWTLRGYYADIPFVSESVYHQVALSEYA